MTGVHVKSGREGHVKGRGRDRGRKGRDRCKEERTGVHREVRHSNLRLYANKVWLGRMKGKEDRWGLKGKGRQGGETRGREAKGR